MQAPPPAPSDPSCNAHPSEFRGGATVHVPPMGTLVRIKYHLQHVRCVCLGPTLCFCGALCCSSRWIQCREHGREKQTCVCRVPPLPQPLNPLTVDLLQRTLPCSRPNTSGVGGIFATVFTASACPLCVKVTPFLRKYVKRANSESKGGPLTAIYKQLGRKWGKTYDTTRLGTNHIIHQHRGQQS